MRKEVLKKLQKYEIVILDEIKRICEKNNLTYYLIAGTLLGAVRHSGFIPWDDDIDIAMPRADYEKFLQIAKYELDPKFFLQTIDSDKRWKRYYSKLRMNNTLFVEQKDCHMDWHHGIFVDIFPFDMGKRNIPILNKIKAVFVRIVNNHIIITNGELPGNRLHYVLSKVLSDDFFLKLRESWSKGKGDCYISYGGLYGIDKEIIEINKCDPPTKVKFEGKEYFAPRDYDYYLRNIYGDTYMELPPVEKRVTHNPVRVSFDVSGEDEKI